MFIDVSQPFAPEQLQIKTNWNGNTLGIRWKLNPIYIKLPKIVTPFHIKTNDDGELYTQLSFEDEDIDPNIRKSLKWLLSLEKYIKKRNIATKFIPKIVKKGDIYHLNITFDKKSEFYNENNQLIPNLKDTKSCSMMTLIEIPHIWKYNESFGLRYKIIQSRLFYYQFRSGVSLLDDPVHIMHIAKTTNIFNIGDVPKSIPPPPPPPPPPSYKRPLPKPALPFLSELLGNSVELKSVNENQSKSIGGLAKIDLKQLLATKNNLKKIGLSNLP